MSDAPKPTEAMTDDEYRDFLSEMHAAVYEESQLYEVARGVTDLVPGESVVHGPWQPEDCSRVLAGWYEMGWLNLYRYNPDGSNGPTLASDEARVVLQDPGCWLGSESQWEGFVALCVTEAGSEMPFDTWIQNAARPRS
jgi:hypothetical protein